MSTSWKCEIGFPSAGWSRDGSIEGVELFKVLERPSLWYLSTAATMAGVIQRRTIVEGVNGASRQRGC